MQETILIPMERIAVLIGKKGNDRRALEKLGKVKFWIDSNSNEVTINSNDVDKIYFAKRVVELVGRGFSPKSAAKIFDDKYSAELIDLSDFGAKERKQRERMVGRLIGTKGRTKLIMEKETNTEIVIYGKTIGILGKSDDVENARQAIEAILTGSKQGTAYKILKQD
ncbi:RNA-processing protein [Candidatus Woesearchaeota archaeon]|jgi:ribosomal RNA assembly protein|nr:RNA-processing protein [Candidatus Woesearchaeota archaeon]